MTKENDYMLVVDRSKEFCPEEFIDLLCSIWLDPTDREDQDRRSILMREIDFSKVNFETCLKPDEIFISGEEKLKRLKADNLIRLDAGVGQALLEEPGWICLEWLRREKGIEYLDFFGTVLRDMGAVPRSFHLVTWRCVLELYFRRWKGWDRTLRSLDGHWYPRHLSAALKIK